MPKLIDLKKKYDRNTKLIEHAFEDSFQRYLIERYKSYSYLNLLVFHNQQRLLKDLYIPLTLHPTSTTKGESKFPRYYLVEEYDEAFVARFGKLLITDTAGMGKSTILKRLFLSIIETNKGVPVLIELRRLNKDRKIIDEIIDELRLINDFRTSESREFILDLIFKGNFIFLFDGYDEISIDNREAATLDIQQFIKRAGNNTFVLTSRPEKALASFGEFREFKIQPLTDEESFALLRKYDTNGKVSASLIEKLREPSFKGIREFTKTPLLVSLLFAGYEYKQIIPFKKHIFYRQVYDALFESHDLSKGDSFSRPKKCKLGIDDFHGILRHIGFTCLKLNKIEFDKDEILFHIKKAREFNVGKSFSESDFLYDLVSTVPLFSKDGLYYRWAHKSIQEYFAAQFIYLDAKHNQESILLTLFGSTEVEKYFNVFDIYYDIDYKTFRQTVMYSFAKQFIEYCDITISNIDRKLVLARRSLTFINDNAFLVKVEVNDIEINLDTNWDQYWDIITSKAFDLINSSSDEKPNPLLVVQQIEHAYYGVRSVLVVNVNDYSKNGLMVNLMAGRGEWFIKRIEAHDYVDEELEGIVTNGVYQVNDIEPTAAINNKRNFKKLNTILEHYQAYSFTLDYKEVLKLIKEIEKEIRTHHEDDIFNLGS